MTNYSYPKIKNGKENQIETIEKQIDDKNYILPEILNEHVSKRQGAMNFKSIQRNQEYNKNNEHNK